MFGGKKERDPLADAIRRLGEPSWLVLRVLSATQPRPAMDVLARVEALLEDADYPYKSLDPSTIHYALKRMAEAKLIRRVGAVEVMVPTGHGDMKPQMRPVYVIDGLGERALQSRDRLAGAELKAATLVGRMVTSMRSVRWA